MKTKTKVELAILVFLVVVGAVTVPNAQGIGDWFHSLTYSPSQLIEDVAGDAGMNETGKSLFYRFSPTLLEKSQLEQSCDFESETVLGCISGNRINLLRFEDEGEYYRTIVTAAHEMLHVAYSRIEGEEKNSLDLLLKAEIGKVPLEIRKDIREHSDHDIQLDEAHSIIGSQVADISPELEQHYSQYFADRSKTTDAYRNSPER